MRAFEIFRAIPADAREIGVLRASNWREQYASLTGVTLAWMNREVERIAGDEGNKQRAHWISEADKPGALNFWLVAKTKDRVLAGYLEARRYSNGKQELRSLHLAPAMRGQGVGQALIDRAHSTWFDPREAIFLDVAEVNERGQKFYLREPNCYQFTRRRFFYGPITMREMVRQPWL